MFPKECGSATCAKLRHIHLPKNREGCLPSYSTISTGEIQLRSSSQSGYEITSSASKQAGWASMSIPVTQRHRSTGLLIQHQTRIELFMLMQMSHRSKSGFAEEYDTRKLKDKNGNPVLCHDCGKSAVDGQQIISCDYCPLHWHLDCIRPMPMSLPPSGKKKWMCPAHVDWAVSLRKAALLCVLLIYLNSSKGADPRTLQLSTLFSAEDTKTTV
jgi:hypothetical protein